MTLAPLLAVALLSPVQTAKDTPAQAAFKKMKTLVGKWQGTMGEGTASMQAAVEYKLTGSGTALVETLGPDSPFEMVSVYHMDNGNLMMTHYCGAGNQPTMMLKPGKSADTLFFDFVRGSNMKPKDTHMHSETYKFLGPDHIIADWVSFQGGKPGEHAKFDFRRVK